MNFNSYKQSKKKGGGFFSLKIFLIYLGLSGLGGLSMKLLFVTFEMGTDGRFFSEGAGAINHKTNVSIYKCKDHWLTFL